MTAFYRRSAWAGSSRRRRLVFVTVIVVEAAAGIVLFFTGHGDAGGTALALLALGLVVLNLTIPAG